MQGQHPCIFACNNIKQHNGATSMSDILAQLRAVNVSNKPATEPCDLIAQLNAIKVRDKHERHERAITLHKTEQQLRYMIDKNGQLKCATLASNPIRRGYKTISTSTPSNSPRQL